MRLNVAPTWSAVPAAAVDTTPKTSKDKSHPVQRILT